MNFKKAMQDNQNTTACWPQFLRYKGEGYNKFNQEALEYAIEYHLKEILKIEQELARRDPAAS